MKKLFLQFWQHQLFKGSMVMFVGTMVANFGNYLYHLLMGRFLGPQAYGELESVISLLYLLFIVVNSLTLVVAKYTAHLKGQKNKKGIAFLFNFFLKNVLRWGSLVSLALLLLSPFIIRFLHLPSVWPLIFASLMFLISSASMVHRAVLQGLLRFKKLVLVHILETSAKVVLGLVLLFLGLGVSGGVLALLLAGFLALFLARHYLAGIRKLKPQKPALRQKTIFKFGLPVLIFNLSFTSLYTTDVLLVKHFFSGHQAGLYASLSVLGKIVFFANSAVSQVMFPMVAERRSQGQAYHRLLLVSLGLVVLVCLGVLLVYLFLPELMVSLLFGRDYLAIAPLLFWMGLFIAFYSLSYLLTNFFVSADQTNAVVFGLLGALSQIVLVWQFHASLLVVLKISLLVCSLLFVVLVLYFFYGQKKVSFGYRPRV